MLNQEVLDRAAAGDVAAMMEIGNAYYIGKGVKQDAEKAKLWWDRAEQYSRYEPQKVPAEVRRDLPETTHESAQRKHASGSAGGNRVAMIYAGVLFCLCVSVFLYGVIHAFGRKTVKPEQPASLSQQEVQLPSIQPKQDESEKSPVQSAAEAPQPAPEVQTFQATEPAEEAPEETAAYLLPQSGQRRLTEADIQGLTAQELNYAKNEIYARHGRMFRSAELAAYFGSCSWYAGTVAPEAFSETVLSETEKENIEFLRDAEWNRMPGGYVLDCGANPGAASALSEETLRQLSAYLSRIDNYGFLLSYYDDSRDLNLDSLFYNAAGLENQSSKPGVYDAAVNLLGELHGDLIALRSSDLDTFLRDKTGYSLSDMRNTFSMPYDSGTDMYYRTVSDTNYSPVECSCGRMDEAGNYILDCTLPYWGGRQTRLTLRPDEDGFCFVSNQVPQISEEEALQIARGYWNLSPSDTDYFVMYQGPVTDRIGSVYHYYILKQFVTDHWSAIDYLYICADDGATLAQRP